MERLSPSDARQLAAQVAEHLGRTDRDRLDALVELAESTQPLTVEDVHHRLFADRTLASANTARERLIENIAEAAAGAGVDFAVTVVGAKRLGVRREVVLEGELAIVGAPLTQLESHRDHLVEPRARALRAGRKLRILLLASAQDQAAEALWDTLVPHLSFPSRPEGHEVWRHSDLLPGDEVAGRALDYAARADLAVFALSARFFNDPAALGAMAAFLGQRRSGPPRHPVGVLLRPFNVLVQDLNGLDPTAIFPPEVPSGPAQRETWATLLANHLRTIVEVGAPANTTVDDHDGPDEEEVPLRELLKLEGRLYPTEARRTRLKNAGGDGPDLEGESFEALRFLIDWARSPEEPPLCALLGEYGMGKTVTSQMLVGRLRAERAAGRPAPDAHYFDLRRATDARAQGRVPTALELMAECIRRDWPLGSPSAEALLHRAKARPALFVFDGLDELLVHLREADGTELTRGLLALRPRRRDGRLVGELAGADTKVLVTCRTHYFKSLQEQNTHFTLRDDTRPDDFSALVLLPLNDTQRRTYLGHCFGEAAVERLIDLLGSVHDLTDLTTRPFALAKVAERIPEIERAHLAGRRVYAATLYRWMVEEWLDRDKEKHQLDALHKAGLMADLAVDAWRRGSRVIGLGELNAWLHRRLAADEDLALRYRKADDQKLEEDLRTATFLVREDDPSGGGGGGFRFAHTSIQEFFVADALVRAVRADRPEVWAVPPPSPETLAFVGQLIAEDPQRDALVANLERWRTPYRAGTSELLLTYALAALEASLPAPRLTGIDLGGADLRELRVPAALRLDLSRAVLRGARLDRADLAGVRLRSADLRGASLVQAVLDDVDLSHADFGTADARGAVFHCCVLDGIEWQGGGEASRVIESPSAERPVPAGWPYLPASRPRCGHRAATPTGCGGWRGTMTAPVSPPSVTMERHGFGMGRRGNAPTPCTVTPAGC